MLYEMTFGYYFYYVRNGIRWELDPRKHTAHRVYHPSWEDCELVGVGFGPLSGKFCFVAGEVRPCRLVLVDGQATMAVRHGRQWAILHGGAMHLVGEERMEAAKNNSEFLFPTMSLTDSDGTIEVPEEH
jgi:hypothetical protein